MDYLFDLIEKAQNGQAINNMAAQFGMSSEQMQQAVQAVMPAFSYGLKRNTQDPMGLQSFLSALGTGHHQNYFNDQAAAFGETGHTEGNAILGHLFGSKDVSRAIAQQASFTSGIGADIVQKMLPIIASMIMGGLSRQTQSGSGPLGNIMDIFMQGMAGEGMAGGDRNSSSNQRAGTGNPMGDLLGNILGGFFGGQSQNKTQDKTDEPQKPQSGADMFGDMFEAGRSIQKTQNKAVQDIFDQFLDGMRR